MGSDSLTVIRMSVWDRCCLLLNRRSGDWNHVRTIIHRRHLLYVSTCTDQECDQFVSSHGTQTTKLVIERKFRLKDYKLRVGKCNDEHFCLFLITGYVKVTLGFECLDLLKDLAEILLRG